MALPNGAVFEAQPAGGLAIWDVGHLLDIDDRRPYPSRDPDNINRIYVHHSGADGPMGFMGAVASARYVVNERHWPGAAYHYWCPTEPDIDSSGRLVIYRMNDDDVRCYHTGGSANDLGIGVALQGNLSKHPPTDAQIEIMEGLIPYLVGVHRLTRDNTRTCGEAMPDGGAQSNMLMCDENVDLSWHSDSKRFGGTGKPTCPGPFMTMWLRQYRLGMVEA